MLCCRPREDGNVEAEDDMGDDIKEEVEAGAEEEAIGEEEGMVGGGRETGGSGKSVKWT